MSDVIGWVVFERGDGMIPVCRQTPKFWMKPETRDWDNSEYESRYKKRSGDRIYDTFDEAKSAIVSIARTRLERAESFTPADSYWSASRWDDLKQVRNA